MFDDGYTSREVTVDDIDAVSGLWPVPNLKPPYVVNLEWDCIPSMEAASYEPGPGTPLSR